MLSDKQIQELYKFCSKHYVSYYDVQTELVDHLASSVEVEMQLNGDLDFDKALEKVYLSFGINGFSTIVREKSESLTKENRMRMFGILASFFKWPTIILTGTYLFTEVLLYKNYGKSIVAYFVIISSLLTTVPQLVNILLTRQKPKSPLLVNDFGQVYLSNSLAGIWIQYLGFIFNLVCVYNWLHVDGPNFSIVWSIVATILLVIENAVLMTFQRNQNCVQRKYPAAF
ncbi:MAG: hypothetical protein JSS70_13115 [Bacteroidetes bacterium]|nr:hypothetical protein [Bacteroidota bacterium]